MCDFHDETHEYLHKIGYLLTMIIFKSQMYGGGQANRSQKQADCVGADMVSLPSFL